MVYYLLIYFQSVNNYSAISSGVRNIPLIVLFSISTFASSKAVLKMVHPKDRASKSLHFVGANTMLVMMENYCCVILSQVEEDQASYRRYLREVMRETEADARGYVGSRAGIQLTAPSLSTEYIPWDESKLTLLHHCPHAFSSSFTLFRHSDSTIYLGPHSCCMRENTR